MKAFMTRRHFHGLRLIAWTVQVPMAIFTSLKGSVAYLVFLSLAALMESAFTDYDQARQKDKEHEEEAQQ
jgi:hypothetical protein